jgi:hypothetical protein
MNVSAACRTFGVQRSTYYVWKRQVERHGREDLRPRGRRKPKMPNQLSKMIDELILSFSIAHPELGPKRVPGELAREKWGAIVVSPNAVWKVMVRHGLTTRAKRFALVAGYAAAYEPPREAGNADEVAAVVNFARENGLRVAVRAEGHGAVVARDRRGSRAGAKRSEGPAVEHQRVTAAVQRDVEHAADDDRVVTGRVLGERRAVQHGDGTGQPREAVGADQDVEAREPIDARLRTLAHVADLGGEHVDREPGGASHAPPGQRRASRAERDERRAQRDRHERVDDQRIPARRRHERDARREVRQRLAEPARVDVVDALGARHG